jgi:hypothetical protein
MKRFSTQFPVCSSRREEALVPSRFEPCDLGCYRVPTAALLLLIWTFAACTAWAQGTTVFVPGGLANVEGNSSSADLFNTSGSIFQQVYSASEFGFAPASRIDGMSFRLDGGSGQSFVGFWPNTAFILSTTARSPDSLSPVYGDNAGSDSVEVFGGPLGILATNSSPVRPFEINVRFTTPFLYDPSKGNLSVYMGIAPGPVNLALDSQLAPGDSVGRVFGGYSTTGTPDTLGLVTRFDVIPIPEPSISILTLFAASILCALRVCSRRRNR